LFGSNPYKNPYKTLTKLNRKDAEAQRKHKYSLRLCVFAVQTPDNWGILASFA